jgi:hypothetical protein
MLNLNKKVLIENAKTRLNQQIENALGFKIDIDTLTGIKQAITTQKFYTVTPSEYMPVVVGENAFAETIITYKEYLRGDGFESGLIHGGGNNTRMAMADVAMEAVPMTVLDWAMGINYNLIELGKASQSRNWNMIEAKERSRFIDYQLGIQKVAFLGSKYNSNVKGLLTQSGVNSNTVLIPTFISKMTTTQFFTMIKGIAGAYSANTNYSEIQPNMLLIPLNDFQGLSGAVSETYPNITKLEWLINSLKTMTGNNDFQVKPLAYAQKGQNTEFLGAGSGLNRYVLYRKDPLSGRMDIPLDFTTTVVDTINGFEYQSAAYARFAGFQTYRDAEFLYFDHSESF